MKAGIRVTLALALSAAAIGGGTATAGADVSSKASAGKRDCGPTSLGQARSTYATYVQDLKVRRTSCKKGWKVVRAFHECRKENGGKNGRCKSRVKRFKCKEGKRTGVKGVRYTANVTCKKGVKKVKHRYDMAL